MARTPQYYDRRCDRLAIGMICFAEVVLLGYAAACFWLAA